MYYERASWQCSLDRREMTRSRALPTQPTLRKVTFVKSNPFLVCRNVDQIYFHFGTQSFWHKSTLNEGCHNARTDGDKYKSKDSSPPNWNCLNFSRAESQNMFLTILRRWHIGGLWFGEISQMGCSGQKWAVSDILAGYRWNCFTILFFCKWWE